MAPGTPGHRGRGGSPASTKVAPQPARREPEHRARAGWREPMPNAFALAYSEPGAFEPLPSFGACLCGSRSLRRVSARPGWLRVAATSSPLPPGFFWPRWSEPSLPEPDGTRLRFGSRRGSVPIGQSLAPQPAWVQAARPHCAARLRLAVCVVSAQRGVYLETAGGGINGIPEVGDEGTCGHGSARRRGVNTAGLAGSQIREIKGSVWGVCEGMSTCVRTCVQACAPELEVKSQPNPSPKPR